jgi:SAM-dependent methyltransferase
MFEEWYLNDLLSQKIRNVWKLTDHYLLKLLFNILDESKILDYLKKPVKVDDIIKSQGYPQKVSSALKWILERLLLDGYLSRTNEGKDAEYCLTDKQIEYDLTEIKERARTQAPESIAAFNMLELMANFYPIYFRGEKSCVDVIFSPENIETTNEYYTNNLFYKVHNIAGAKILNWDIDQRNKPVIVEIGGGLGGGTKQFLIQRLESENKSMDFTYHFTDVANKMLRNTRRELEKINPEISMFKFQKLDFNKPFEEQGFHPGSVDVIWGVNAVHVAFDLRFTLEEIKKTLRPGGSLIVCETVRPLGNSMIQQELILNTLDDYWNVKLDDEIRPRHGFMDWKYWVSALSKMGFADARSIPDMSIVDKEYDNCYITVVRGIKA